MKRLDDSIKNQCKKLAQLIDEADAETLVETIFGTDDIDAQFFFLIALAKKDDAEARAVFKTLVENDDYNVYSRELELTGRVEIPGESIYITGFYAADAAVSIVDDIKLGKDKAESFHKAASVFEGLKMFDSVSGKQLA